MDMSTSTNFLLKLTTVGIGRNLKGKFSFAALQLTSSPRLEQDYILDDLTNPAEDETSTLCPISILNLNTLLAPQEDSDTSDIMLEETPMKVFENL